MAVPLVHTTQIDGGLLVNNVGATWWPCFYPGDAPECLQLSLDGWMLSKRRSSSEAEGSFMPVWRSSVSRIRQLQFNDKYSKTFYKACNVVLIERCKNKEYLKVDKTTP
jgi:hypothetical protein